MRAGGGGDLLRTPDSTDERPTVFGDGRQTRDWVEVGDVVRANLLAADATT